MQYSIGEEFRNVYRSFLRFEYHAFFVLRWLPRAMSQNVLEIADAIVQMLLRSPDGVLRGVGFLISGMASIFIRPSQILFGNDFFPQISISLHVHPVSNGGTFGRSY